MAKPYLPRIIVPDQTGCYHETGVYVDIGKVVDVICLQFSNAFDTVYLSTLERLTTQDDYKVAGK